MRSSSLRSPLAPVIARYLSLKQALGRKYTIEEWVFVDLDRFLADDEVMATALLDRLLHKCHVLNIKGRSYRLRDLDRMLKTA